MIHGLCLILPYVSKASCLHNFPLPLYIANTTPTPAPYHPCQAIWRKEAWIIFFIHCPHSPAPPAIGTYYTTPSRIVMSTADRKASAHVCTHIHMKNHICLSTWSRNHRATSAEPLFKVSKCWKEERVMRISGKKPSRKRTKKYERRESEKISNSSRAWHGRDLLH